MVKVLGGSLLEAPLSVCVLLGTEQTEGKKEERNLFRLDYFDL